MATQFIDISRGLKENLLKQAMDKLDDLEKTNRAAIYGLKRKLENRIKRLIRERTAAGYDSNGQKFAALKYDKKLAFKYLKGKKTTYASDSTSDNIRLSGQIMSGLEVKVIDFKIDSQGVFIEYDIDVKGSRNKKVAMNLESDRGTARNKKRYSKARRQFLRLATRGEWKTKEENAQLSTIAREFRFPLR
jgi:hypothetical protein